MSTSIRTKKVAGLFTGAVLAMGMFGGAAAAAATPTTTSAAPTTKPQTSKTQVPSQKQHDPQVKEAQKNIKKVDDSHLAFRLAPGDKLAKDGAALIAEDGAKEELPATAKDKNGQEVELKYTEEDGVVTVTAVDESALAGKGGVTDEDWRCAAGVAGGTGTGAVTGGAAGATIGSVVPGAGTAAGWAIGTAIGGAVSGGLVGAAAAC